MVGTIKDWKGGEIRIAQSKGGKMSVCNYEDNLIIPSGHTWPHPDILKKLYRSNHGRDFDTLAFSRLSKKLGFYCDLQSLRSEDAITWSVFGTLHYFPKESQVDFVNSLLEKVGEKCRVDDCLIQLWTRIAHPDTLVSGGPELDFQIIGNNLIIFGEAKWTSKVATDQGKKKDKDQLQLRREFLQKYGQKIFRKAERTLVLLVELREKEYDAYPVVTWKRICGETKHPLGDEIRHYYTWKAQYGI